MCEKKHFDQYYVVCHLNLLIFTSPKYELKFDIFSNKEAPINKCRNIKFYCGAIFIPESKLIPLSCFFKKKSVSYKKPFKKIVLLD